MFLALAFRFILSATFLLTFLLASEAEPPDLYESVENRKAEAFGNRVCANKACAQYAAQFIHNGNEKVKPCEDFGSYACENFKMHHHKNGNNFHEGDSLILRRVKKFLAEPESSDDKPWHKLTKSYYQKCISKMIFPAFEASKLAVAALIQELGGWPILNTTSNTFTLSFEEYIADIHKKYAANVLFKAEVDMMPNTTEKRLFLKAADDVVMQPALLHHLPGFYGSQNTMHNIRDEILAVELFEEQRQKIRNEAVSQITRCGPLRLMYAENFDIQKYVHRLYEGILPVDPRMTVCIQPVDYFDKLHTLLQDKTFFANYAVFMPNVDHGEICIDYMKQDYFNDPITQMYVKKHFELDVFVPKITEMVTLMKEELAELINEASWLDDFTRKNALNKLNNMKLNIGYNENLFNDTYYEETWNVPPPDSSENIYTLDARIARKRIAVNLAEINQQSDNWSPSAIPVNAYYANYQNKIYVPLGLLQPPFYDPNVPDYINFAAVGHLVGHEMMHGFDNYGRFIDANGYDIDWWTNETSNHYVGKTDCYKKQYNDVGVDGELSLGENIADNVGMKIAYRAYKKMMAKRGGPAEPALPTFEKFSLDQMFFLANANAWCSIPKTIDPNDPHPPITVRLTMVMRNMKPFSEAFSCPKSAKMNPEQKCYVWQP